MESLDNIEWDVLIVGTSLQQSLLALYVDLAVSHTSRRNLTNVVPEELCLALGRKSSTSIRIATMEAPKRRSACKKLKTGLGK